MSNGTVLFIGDANTWPSNDQNLFENMQFKFCRFDEFDDACFERLAPTIVITSLIGGNFDAIDIAQRLERLRFPGIFRILSPQLPRPSMITRELRSHAPSIRFDLIQVEPR